MKTETLFASILLSLLTCLPVALAAPVGGYNIRTETPLPGESGVHFDKENNKKVVHINYGDNDMPGHMEHQMYNVRKHPENNQVFRPGKSHDTSNRKKAMGTTEPVPGFVRDEKPLNSMHHNGKTTTMRYLPQEESQREFQLTGLTTKKAKKERAGIQLHANPGPNYHGRGERSLSPQSAPGVKTGTSSRAPWNAGPGRQRSDSAGPYPKGRAPESRPKLVPKATIEQLKDGIPTRGRSPGPVQVAGPSKQRAREPSRSPSRDHSPGAPEPPRSPTPDTKGKGPAASSKPPWNAGPGAQAAVRKSSRIAELPKKKT